jgi:MA3 domain
VHKPRERNRHVQDDAQPGMLHIFVRTAIAVALERSFRERELTSLLFLTLVPNPIPESAMLMAFTRLLASCEDLILDVPDAPHMLTLFLSRLIVDEVVPPVFLTRVLEGLRPDTLGVQVVRNTGRLLSGPHAAERVLQVRACCKHRNACGTVHMTAHS